MLRFLEGEKWWSERDSTRRAWLGVANVDARNFSDSELRAVGFEGGVSSAGVRFASLVCILWQYAKALSIRGAPIRADL